MTEIRSASPPGDTALDVEALRNLLASSFELSVGKLSAVRRTALDTFDRRLERGGQRLQLVAAAGEEQLPAGAGRRDPRECARRPPAAVAGDAERAAGRDAEGPRSASRRDSRPARCRRAPTAGAPSRAAQRGRERSWCVSTRRHATRVPALAATPDLHRRVGPLQTVVGGDGPRSTKCFSCRGSMSFCCRASRCR